MSRISFQKRQKEMKRQEKQREKAERRAARKVLKNAAPTPETAAQLEGEFASSDNPEKD